MCNIYELADNIAVFANDTYVHIHECDDGYDYSVLDKDFHLKDGGIYDDHDISIHDALHEIVSDFLPGCSFEELSLVDYDMVTEMAEKLEKLELTSLHIVTSFTLKTLQLFHPIGGCSADEVVQIVSDYIREKIQIYKLDVTVTAVVLTGSRCRGLETENSDIDFVVEYMGSIREDAFFDILHEDHLCIADVPVDINPISIAKGNSIADYLVEAEKYLDISKEGRANCLA